MNDALDWVDEPHRFRILHEGRLLTAYNKGNPQYGDFFKAFPNIEPVHTLSGLPVTASGAANFNHHKSVFLGLGRLNGHNFYHDCYPPFAAYRPGPSPFFATDHRLAAGERLLFRYRVVVHDGDASAVDLPRLFDEFRRGPRLKNPEPYAAGARVPE